MLGLIKLLICLFSLCLRYREMGTLCSCFLPLVPGSRMLGNRAKVLTGWVKDSLFVPHGPGCGTATHQTQKESTPQVWCFCKENRFKPSKLCETAQAGHSYLDESKRHHLLAAAHGALTTGHRQQLDWGTSYSVFSFPARSAPGLTQTTEPALELPGGPVLPPWPWLLSSGWCQERQNNASVFCVRIN